MERGVIKSKRNMENKNLNKTALKITPTLIVANVLVTASVDS